MPVTVPSQEASSAQVSPDRYKEDSKPGSIE